MLCGTVWCGHEAHLAVHWPQKPLTPTCLRCGLAMLTAAELDGWPVQLHRARPPESLEAVCLFPLEAVDEEVARG